MWRFLLWALVIYLLTLAATALILPSRARAFLDGFASDWRANLFEASVRALAGLAFIAAASTTKLPQAGRLIGVFLFATAVLMALLPGLHQRFARPATRFIFSILPLFGLLSVGLACALVWFII